MFARLYEGFTTDQSPQQFLDENIVRYNTQEPNYVVFTGQQGYNFPTAPTTSNQGLQTALNALGTSPQPLTSGVTTATPNVGAVFTGVTDAVGDSLQACRQFTGLAGLSNLQGTTANQKCGWRYAPPPRGGITPLVAQGAYGNRTEPIDPAFPKRDTVGNGTRYFWDLAAAEKAMVTDVCKAATTCEEMAALGSLGNFGNLCGYCTSSQKVIPIRKMASGGVQARYADVDVQCAPQNILSAADAVAGKCPASADPAAAAAAAASPAVKCSGGGALERDCLILSAQLAGCSSDGALIQALQSGSSATDYANTLRQKKSFQEYQRLANPILSEDMLKTGNATMYAAFTNIENVNKSTYAQQNERLRIAAKDMCRQAGLYEQHDFCADLTDSTREYEVGCMQKEFLKQGGTPAGSAYPKTKTVDIPWGEYRKTISDLVTQSRSTDANTQRNGYNKLVGLNLDGLPPPAISKDEENQGVEIYWHDRRTNTVMGRRPTRSLTGSNLPSFNIGEAIVEDTGLANYVGFYAILDLRPATAQSFSFGAVTDDGFGFAINQDLFTAKDYSRAYMGAMYLQPPTWHASQCIALNPDKSNMFSLYWYEHGGGACFLPSYRLCTENNYTDIIRSGQPLNSRWKSMCYFTQEVAAPSLKFEVYSRQGITQFCERRLWSYLLPSANMAGISYLNNGPTRKVMKLERRQWQTAAQIAYSGFHTVSFSFSINTIIDGVRPIFTWGKFQIVGTPAAGNKCKVSATCPGLFTTDAFTIPTNTWCLGVLLLDEFSKFDKRIRGVRFFVTPLMEGGITVPNPASYVSPTQLANEYKLDNNAAGTVILGNPGISMTVGWLHFYDDVIDPADAQSWKNEVLDTWKGAWFE